MWGESWLSMVTPVVRAVTEMVRSERFVQGSQKILKSGCVSGDVQQFSFAEICCWWAAIHDEISARHAEICAETLVSERGKEKMSCVISIAWRLGFTSWRYQRLLTDWEKLGLVTQCCPWFCVELQGLQGGQCLYNAWPCIQTGFHSYTCNSLLYLDSVFHPNMKEMHFCCLWCLSTYQSVFHFCIHVYIWNNSIHLKFLHSMEKFDLLGQKIQSNSQSEHVCTLNVVSVHVFKIWQYIGMYSL